MTSMWVNQSDWSASWKVSAGSAGTRRQMRAISSSSARARRVGLRLRQPFGFVRVASGEGDGGFAADDERAQEVALRRVGLPGPHLFQLGGDSAEAQSQHLRVVGDEVAGDGAAVAGAAVVESSRLLKPAADAPLPFARLGSSVGL